MNTLEFGRSGGLLKYRKSETPKIRKFGRSGGLLKYRNSKDSFGRSGLAVRVTSEEWKKPSFINSELGSGGLLKNENPKVKIHSGGLPKNENPKVKIRSGGLLKNGKRRTFKIRSGGFLSVSSEEWKKPRFFSGLLKNNGKPRFVSSGRLSKNENPKIKICSGRLLKNENPKVRWASEK
ncbi:hypothetical protein RhiirB3_452986 [Rhizophagus irregularis]|nr:hypothetical protein RhiirB3_452986 [Rhizophagus irregularis]